MDDNLSLTSEAPNLMRLLRGNFLIQKEITRFSLVRYNPNRPAKKELWTKVPQKKLLVLDVLGNHVKTMTVVP